MKLIASIVALLAAASVCAVVSGADPGPPPAALPSSMQFIGRWDLRRPGQAVTVYSGSHMVARFDAPSLTARFNISANRAPVPTLAWRIDDSEWQEAEVAQSVKLAEGLKPGEHTLMLMARGLDEHQDRWTPPSAASITFTGLDLAGGKLLEPPAEPRLNIEFLGDSITEGVLVHGDRPGKTTWPWKTDGRLAYPTQTALKLNARWRQCGFGAQGVTHGGSGGVPSALDTFEFVYKDCPRDAWQPDVVVINQGTNDGGASADVFGPAYRRYLEMIRNAYPDAKIAALRPFNGAQAENIHAEVKARNNAGDKHVAYVDTTGWLEAGDYTDGVHPNVQGGAKAAEKLADALRKLVGP